MNPKNRQTLLIFGDIVSLYLSLFIVLVIGFRGEFNWEILSNHLLSFSILYFFWLIIFYIFGLYDLELLKTPSSFYARAFLGFVLSFGLGMIFFYLIPFFGITPKTNLFLNILIFAGLFFIDRNLFYSFFSLHLQNRVAVIGKNPQLEPLIEFIKKNPYLGYKIIAFFNSKEDIFKQIQKNQINTLIIAENMKSNSSLLIKNLYSCLPLKLNFMSLAEAYEVIAEKIPITFVTQTWFLENLKEREKGFYDKTKRTIDLILTSIIFLITLPLWPFIILLIKLSDGGSVFYFQKRIGKDKKPFLLIKFRSMKQDAEKNGVLWAEKEDNRVTKIGKILRRTHLDEIPQVLNILKGDLSLVGPRPERPEFVEKLEKEIPYYHLHHLIRPGLTGWAQVKFRYARSIMDSYEKFQYDLYYLKNRSFFLDFCIFLKTFQWFIRKGE